MNTQIASSNTASDQESKKAVWATSILLALTLTATSCTTAGGRAARQAAPERAGASGRIDLFPHQPIGSPWGIR